MNKNVLFLIAGIVLIIMAFGQGVGDVGIISGPSGLEDVEGLDINSYEATFSDYVFGGLKNIFYNFIGWLGIILIVVYVILAVKRHKN